LLLNDLYIIESLEGNRNGIHVQVKLMPEHAIFKGHFPGQPVLPGVCMLDMITEITGEHLHGQFRISEATMIKFLRMIDPQKNPVIHLEIHYEVSPEAITTSGRIYFGSDTFMKFQLVLTPDPVQ
jgi:3-hydroxyacyl-[acyl-carrier-protein] dehydratase